MIAFVADYDFPPDLIDLQRAFDAADRECVERSAEMPSGVETWAGWQHPTQALEGYGRAVNPQVRVVLAAMAANGHTVGDPRDEGVLNMAGVDASQPMVVNGYIRG